MNTKNCRHMASQIHSPPRITEMIKMLKMSPGMALDLSVNDPDDGKPWDFTDPRKIRTIMKNVMGDIDRMSHVQGILFLVKRDLFQDGSRRGICEV